VSAVNDPYYRRDLARVHHLGYGFHADLCAPSLLALLEPIRARGGLVLELGCGSGLLTRYLLDAGHRVVATDASPAVLELAAVYAAEADLRRLVLPDDRLPDADAVVSIGHVLSYLSTPDAIERALLPTSTERSRSQGGASEPKARAVRLEAGEHRGTLEGREDRLSLGSRRSATPGAIGRAERSD
jgi:SAM-dependent methyltransferase